MGGAEEEKGFRGGVEDEYTRTSVGVPVKGVMVGDLFTSGERRQQIPHFVRDDKSGESRRRLKRRNDEHKGGDGV